MNQIQTGKPDEKLLKKEDQINTAYTSNQTLKEFNSNTSLENKAAEQIKRKRSKNKRRKKTKNSQKVKWQCAEICNHCMACLQQSPLLCACCCVLLCPT